jgi:transcription elongation factor Elf1
MDFIDVKYIGMVSCRLPKFKKVKNGLYNFRCPICGDSKKHLNKARGYLYEVKNNTNYKCHNCGINISFNNFLKTIDSTLYSEYCLEKFKEGFSGKNFPTKEPKFNFKKPIFTKSIKLNLPKASENLEAKTYLKNRKLDPDKFYYADKFKEWTNTLIPTFSEKSLHYEENRIVIPLIYERKLIGYQGRTLGSSEIKYITIMLEDDAPKIYDLDEIEKNKTVYITEGPFDSTFIPNSIALCGSDGDISKFNIHDYVWIYDNEPRNAEIINRIHKCISKGDKVVIWPNHITEKDINAMILAGHDVQAMVESNTYYGLEANLKFTNWKKV